MRAILSALAAIAVLLCTGCASVTQGTTHSLRIETMTDKGQQLEGADCTLANDQGTTMAKSGSSTIVRRSNKDLEITCAAAGQPDARARLVSRANVGLAGNIIIGGAIGAVIDHNTGAAYTYPSWVRLVFGQFNVFDRRDERDGVAMAPFGAVTSQEEPVRLQAAASPRVQRVAVEKGDTFDYRVTDRYTGQQQLVVLRAERVEAGNVLFNGGLRSETATGAVLIAGPLTGELDNVTPPEGWMPGGHMRSGMWKINHLSIDPAARTRYDLEATIEGEQKMVVSGRELRTVRVGLRGWIERQPAGIPLRAAYEGVAWVSPELGRVVRYEVKSRSAGNMGSSSFVIDETAELVRFGRD